MRLGDYVLCLSMTLNGSMALLYAYQGHWSQAGYWLLAALGAPVSGGSGEYEQGEGRDEEAGEVGDPMKGGCLDCGVPVSKPWVRRCRRCNGRRMRVPVIGRSGRCERGCFR